MNKLFEKIIIDLSLSIYSLVSTNFILLSVKENIKKVAISFKYYLNKQIANE